MAALASRIVSLIPSATEIVAALGWGDRLVGRSHECDYPLAVQSLPVCTAPKFNPEGDSAAIHQRVTDLLQSALAVYAVNTELLAQLQPTHIVTQAQCEVCAVSLSDVEQAVAELTEVKPTIVSLQPAVLSDVWQDMLTVGEASAGSTGKQQAESAIAALKQRVNGCVARVETVAQERPTVACIEWIEPLMAAGNWVPELVELAGGISCFGTIGQHSPWITWEALIEADPEIIVVMPCGYTLAQTRAELSTLMGHPGWQQLNAVQNNRVYVVDGNQYFNRPGPRLVDSLEILAEIFYGEQTPYRYRSQGWQLIPNPQCDRTCGGSGMGRSLTDVR